MESQLSTIQVESEQWTVNCQPSKWKVNSGQSTLHTKVQTQLEKKNPYLVPTRIKGRALHSMTPPFTSHWLHGNTIPKIGCHHFWPGLIARLLIRTLGYWILYSFFQKPKTSSSGKKSRNHPILKCSPSVTVESEFILFWGHIVKHFSLEFQQLN